MNKPELKRWAPWLALVLVFAIATSLLSWWQFSRREERVEKINQVISNYDNSAISIDSVSWKKNADGLAALEWQPVYAEGNYLPELVTLVRNRPLNGQPGYLQLIPFKLLSGKLIVVERGWLPTGSEKSLPDLNPLPSREQKRIVVRLRSSEADLGKPPVAGQVASIHLPTLASVLSGAGQVESNFYGRLVEESPASSEYPFLMPKPSLSEGNHLSYAIQWIVFGAMAFWAFLWAYRNDRRLAREASGEIPKRQPKRNQGVLDAEAEDYFG